MFVTQPLSGSHYMSLLCSACVREDPSLILASNTHLFTDITVAMPNSKTLLKKYLDNILETISEPHTIMAENP